MEPNKNISEAEKTPKSEPFRDPAGFDISAHIKITDPESGTVLVNQRG